MTAAAGSFWGTPTRQLPVRPDTDRPTMLATVREHLDGVLVE